MITAFQIYLITMADCFWKGSFILSIVLFISSFLVLIFSENDIARETSMTIDETFDQIKSFGVRENKSKNESIEKLWEKAVKTAKFLACIGFLFLLIGFFTPSTKNLTLMYVIPKIANNKNIQQLPESLLIFIKNYLKNNYNQSGDILK